MSEHKNGRLGKLFMSLDVFYASRGIRIEDNLSRMRWLRNNYGMTLSQCSHIIASGKTGRHIWFDPRYWDAAAIREFFEDLMYADPWMRTTCMVVLCVRNFQQEITDGAKL